MVKLLIQTIRLFFSSPPFVHLHILPSRPNWRHAFPKRPHRPTPLGPTRTSLHTPVSSKRHRCAFRTLASRRQTNTTWRHLNDAIVLYGSVTERKFKHIKFYRKLYYRNNFCRCLLILYPIIRALLAVYTTGMRHPVTGLIIRWIKFVTNALYYRVDITFF